MYKLPPWSLNIENEPIQMIRYVILNSETNMMNFYACQVEISNIIAKEEIAQLISMFKVTYESNTTNNNPETLGGH